MFSETSEPICAENIGKCISTSLSLRDIDVVPGQILELRVAVKVVLFFFYNFRSSSTADTIGCEFPRFSNRFYH